MYVTRRLTRNGNAQLDSRTSCVWPREERRHRHCWLPLVHAPPEARARRACSLVGSSTNGARGGGLVARVTRFRSAFIVTHRAARAPVRLPSTRTRRAAFVASQYLLQLLVHLPTYLPDVARGPDGEKGRKGLRGIYRRETPGKNPVPLSLDDLCRSTWSTNLFFYSSFSSLRLPLLSLLSLVTLL